MTRPVNFSDEGYGLPVNSYCHVHKRALTVVAISALLRRLRIGSAPFATSAIRLASPPTQTTGLVRQIPSQGQIPIESTDGDNLSICLDQQAGERLVTRYRAAHAK